MTVQEMIEELKKYPPGELVVSTWEGVIREHTVYRAKDGTVCIDSDGCFYMAELQSGQLNPKAWRAIALMSGRGKAFE